jgi:hypothetical protein
MGDDPVLYRTLVAPGSPGSPSYPVYRVDLVDWFIRSTPDHVILPRLSHSLLVPQRDHPPTYKEAISPPRGSTVSATSH